ncbi:tetratricopeptide repeat protein [Paenibacillus sp. CAU 1782]
MEKNNRYRRMLEENDLEQVRLAMNVCFGKGKYTEAMAAIHQILRQLPEDREALFVLCQCQWFQGNGIDAIQTGEQLLSLYPQDELVFYLLSQIHVDLRKWSKAIHYLEHTIRLNPRWAEPHYSLARCLLYSYNLDFAVTGHFKLSLSKDFMSMTEQAESEITEAIKLRPEAGLYHAFYGLLLDYMLRPEEAEQKIREAIQLDPLDAVVHSIVAHYHYNQGNFKQFRNHNEQALMLDPNHERALGQVHTLHQYETIPLKIYEGLIELHQTRAKLTKNASVHYRILARLKLEANLEQSLHELRAYCKLVPSDINFKIMYGQALFTKRRYWGAQRYFRSMNRKYPGNPYVKHWLDQCEGVGSWGKYILFPIYSSIERLKYGIRVPFTKLATWPAYLLSRRKLIKRDSANYKEIDQ